MVHLKNILKLMLFGFLILAGLQSEAADKCASADKNKYLKIGNFDSAPGQRIIYFKKLRDDLKSALEKGEADLSQCLYELYDKAAQDEAGFWRAKAAAEGCELENPKECPDPETPRSIAFLENLHTELEADLKEDIAKLPKTEAAAACDEGCDEAAVAGADLDDQAALAEYLQHDQCCGSKEAKLDGELGVVRQHYPGLTYNQCLAKTDKDKKASGLQTAGSCIAGLVANVFKGMFDGVTAFFKLPGELIAARAQIWAIITDSDERARFLEHIKNSLLEFIGVQSGDLTNCLNADAKTKYYCENAGEVIGFLASPALIGNIFKIAKLGVKAAAAAMKTALNSTAKGAAMLAKMNKAVRAAETVASRGQGVASRAATRARLVGLTVATSRIAKMIVRVGSPFTRGAVGAVKMLAPVARVGGKIVTLPSKITDRAIVAGFNAGKKVVENIAAKKSTQVITAGTAATGAAATATGATAATTSTGGTAAAATGDAAEAVAKTAAATTTPSAAPATMAHGAPLEPISPVSISGKPTTIQMNRNAGEAAGAGNTRTFTYRPGASPAVAPEAAVPAGMQPSGIQILPRVQPTTVNPTGNPYFGTPARNLRLNLSGTNSQLAKVEQQLATNPGDAALLQKKSDLLEKKSLLDEALAPKPQAPTPVERVRDGSAQLFQGTPREAATAPQVRAAERNMRTRSSRGGEAEVRTYVNGERERLNGLLSKYQKELDAVKGEAASARPAKERAIQEKIRDARQRLDALEQAERNIQYRRWETQEAG